MTLLPMANGRERYGCRERKEGCPLEVIDHVCMEAGRPPDAASGGKGA